MIVLRVAIIYRALSSIYRICAFACALVLGTVEGCLANICFSIEIFLFCKKNLCLVLARISCLYCTSSPGSEAFMFMLYF